MAEGNGNSWAAKLTLWALGVFAASTMSLCIYTFTDLKSDVKEQRQILTSLVSANKDLNKDLAESKVQSLKNYGLTKRLAKKLHVAILEEDGP